MYSWNWTFLKTYAIRKTRIGEVHIHMFCKQSYLHSFKSLIQLET